MALFGKKYFKVRLDQAERREDEALWIKCKACGELVFKKRVHENYGICPKCREYFFLTCEERIKLLVDEGTFEDVSKPIVAADPLSFSDSKPYPERIKEAQQATGLTNETTIGRAHIGGQPVVLAVMDFRYIGGSMGSVMGEQLCHGMRGAARERIPFVLISSTGGARMQEGAFSLMQMAKTSACRQELERAAVPMICVMTYPTTAGVLASIASLGDITLAEKGALVGFTGKRVIEQTIREVLPDDFQTDRFAYERGIVDRVVRREELRDELITALQFFANVHRPARAGAAVTSGMRLWGEERRVR